MPRELPELIGQPLGWDMFKVCEKDGSETMIERAISINDICPRLGEITSSQQQAVLCFFTDQRHGPCVAFLSILDIDNQLLSEQVGLSMTTLQSVRETAELGKIFLDRIECVYGATRAELTKAILG